MEPVDDWTTNKLVQFCKYGVGHVIVHSRFLRVLLPRAPKIVFQSNCAFIDFFGGGNEGRGAVSENDEDITPPLAVIDNDN